MAKRIAVIGLGAMGLPMAANLLRAGFDARGVDLDAGARAQFAAAGGMVTASAAEAVRDANAVLLTVVNAAQVESILFRGDLAGTLPRDAIVIVSVTMAPDSVRAVGERLSALGIAMLDAPVSGGVERAKAATLTVIAAGPQAAYAKAEPFLRAMASQIFRVGERHGDGAIVKVINQLLCGIHIAATAEAVSLAERAGVDPAMLYEVISASSGNSRIFADRAPRMRTKPGDKRGTVDIFAKDLALVAELAQSVDAALPLSSAALDVFRTTAAAGLGSADDSAIIETYRSARPRS